MLRDIKEHPERRFKTEPSIFGNEEPATMEDIRAEVIKLGSAFPQMPSTFWGFVASEAVRRGLSLKRVQYMVSTIFETYHYPTITMADIFDIDKYIHEVTPQELYSLRIPHEPLAKIFFGGRYRIVYKKDADAYGYPFERFLSNAELEEQERLADEARHKKEWEEWCKEHPEDEYAKESINIEDLANEFSVNKSK